MSNRNTIREYLRARGCADHVVDAGLDGLIAEWERTVKQAESEYPHGLDDYLNDLDQRQLVEDVLEITNGEAPASARNRLQALDRRMKAATRRTEPCLWGEGVADDQGWTPLRNWWYFALPRTPGPVLTADLEGLD